jgi:hypothetical protein
MAYKQPSSGLPFKEIGSSPAKQVVSGDASEAVKHYNKWKADKYSKPNMKATSKGFATDWHLENKKAQNVKLAKVKKPTSNLSRVTNVFKNTPKQLAKLVTSKVASRTIPVVGEALMAYDVLKHGVKNVIEGKAKIPKGHYKKGGKGYQKKDYSKSFNYGDKK